MHQITGSWTLTEVTPANSQGGPGVGTVMTFYANGKFTSNGDEGTFTYDNDSKAFSARIGTVTISGTVNISGSSANAAVTVTAVNLGVTHTLWRRMVHLQAVMTVAMTMMR